jgi:hypothetical protein
MSAGDLGHTAAGGVMTAGAPEVNELRNGKVVKAVILIGGPQKGK